MILISLSLDNVKVFLWLYACYFWLFSWVVEIWWLFSQDSRTRPLAIGDDSIEVSRWQGISINVSEKLVYQRFRNAWWSWLNNVGDYLRGIFGTNPSPDYHFPKFIRPSGFLMYLDLRLPILLLTIRVILWPIFRRVMITFAFEVTVDMPCVPYRYILHERSACLLSDQG